MSPVQVGSITGSIRVVLLGLMFFLFLAPAFLYMLRWHVGRMFGCVLLCIYLLITSVGVTLELVQLRLGTAN